ncbi:lysophosphatidylcholine acyltransferase LPEAT [Acrasis kona]|uniref:Lysophosphatidylcholine acyltransferase LPEAT n=1 Tax=Acrasis kona TaxID=1008807 RepID=A0AAW2ZK48_9EUKA
MVEGDETAHIPLNGGFKTKYDSNDIDEIYSPFVRRDYPITNYEKCKLIFNAIFLLPLRVFIIGILCFIFWVVSNVVFIGMDSEKRSFDHLRGMKKWLYLSAGYFCRVGLFSSGFLSIQRWHVTKEQMDKIRRTDLKINVENIIHDSSAPCTIVCNHISMLDVIVLLSEFNITSFVAHERLKDTVFFGKWMKQINCLFVSEDNKKELADLIKNRQMLHDFKSTRMVIFPEGTTTNGSYHILFNRGAFSAGMPVQPCMLRYPWNHFCPSWETIPVHTYFLRLLTQFYIPLHVIHFPIYYPSLHEQNDPTVFAANVRHVMTKCTNRMFTKQMKSGYKSGLEIIKVGNQTRKDKLSLHDRIINGEFEWTKNKNF